MVNHFRRLGYPERYSAKNPMNAEAVIQSFCDARPIRNKNITDRIALKPDLFSGVVKCRGVRFASFAATFTFFDEPVTFENCQFVHLDFYATYFLKGLTITDCIVNDRLTFQSGGHNYKELSITITNTRFDSFVDFEDCWFTGPFTLQNVIFAQGTNLLGNQNNPMAVSFDFEPKITDVEGKLDVNTYKPPD